MKFKRGIAVFMAMMVFCTTTAFGGETTTEENPVRVISYDEALELATKHSYELKSSKLEMEKLEDSREDVWYALDGQTTPGTSTGTTYLDSFSATYLNSLNAIEASIKTLKYSDEIQKVGLETQLLTYLLSTQVMEDSINICEETVEISRQTTHFARIQYDLGLISKNELDEAISKNSEIENTYEKVKNSYAQQYNSFASFLGLKDTNFVVDYEFVYEAYPECGDLDAFANRLASNDLSLKILDNQVSVAQFSKDFTALEDGASFDERNRDLASAGINYNKGKDQLVLSIKNAYLDLKNIELEIEDLNRDLENTKKSYETGLLQYELGYITKTELKGMELALKQAETELKEFEMNHTLNKFLLNHPYLLATS